MSTQLSTKIRWGWVVLGAVLLEVALIILFVPFLMVMDVSRIAPFAGIATSGLGFLVSWWVVRKVPGRRVLHGTLIGVVATLIYAGLCMVQPGGISSVASMYGPVLFVIGNGLRIFGSAAGGYYYRSH